jgi:hypothetical protein
METKPYNLQSPEQIAKDYGGNKQKIAEAMQMGILDPTAGTLAGMFIDRMRSAQMQEMAPQQTVAQQVFAPPAPPMGAMPPAGLGATPEAGAMAGAPPQMMGSPSPSMGDMPPPQGMAAGGLTTLPLPDDMFSEPDYGGYASGGLVAFSTGNLVEDEDLPNVDGGELPVTGPERDREPPPFRDVRINPLAFDVRPEIAGFKDSLLGNLGSINQASPYNTAQAQRYAEYLEGQLSPEQRAQRRQEDMWATLGQVGARMASTPGSLLQAIGAGVGEAVPNVARSLSERRAEERAVRQELLGEERTGNEERMGRVAVGLDMLKNFSSLEEAQNDRDFMNYYTTLDRNQQRELELAAIASGITTARMQVGAQMRGQDLDYKAAEDARRDAERRADADAFATYIDANPVLKRRYLGLRNSADPEDQQRARNIENNFFRTREIGAGGGNVRTFNPVTGRIE